MSALRIPRRCGRMRSASAHSAKPCEDWNSGMVFHPYTAHPFSAVVRSTHRAFQPLEGYDLIGRIVHLAQRQQICAIHAVQPDRISVPFSAGTDKHTGAEVRGVVVVGVVLRQVGHAFGVEVRCGDARVLTEDQIQIGRASCRERV